VPSGAGRGDAELHCSFGATRVRTLLARVRLHLATDRFLAERRRDAVWEAACDYAALAVGRIESRLRPTALDAPLAAALHTSHADVRRLPAQDGRRR